MRGSQVAQDDCRKRLKTGPAGRPTPAPGHALHRPPTLHRPQPWTPLGLPGSITLADVKCAGRPEDCVPKAAGHRDAAQHDLAASTGFPREI